MVYRALCHVTFCGRLLALRALLPQTGPALWLYSWVLARTVKAQVAAQGTGRLTPGQVMHRAAQLLSALTDFLGKHSRPSVGGTTTRVHGRGQ